MSEKQQDKLKKYIFERRPLLLRLFALVLWLLCCYAIEGYNK